MKTKLIIAAALCALTSCHLEPKAGSATEAAPDPEVAVKHISNGNNSVYTYKITTRENEFLVAANGGAGGIVILEQKPINPKPEKP